MAYNTPADKNTVQEKGCTVVHVTGRTVTTKL